MQLNVWHIFSHVFQNIPFLCSQNEDDNNSGSGHPPKKKPTRLAIGEFARDRLHWHACFQKNKTVYNKEKLRWCFFFVLINSALSHWDNFQVTLAQCLSQLFSNQESWRFVFSQCAVLKPSVSGQDTEPYK